MTFTNQFYKHFISRACALFVFLLCLCRAEAQITVNATVGTTSASYSSFNAAITAINSGTHKGSIRIRVHTSVAETVATSLEASGATSSSYSALLITPADTATVMKTISISTTGVTLFTLNGADNVTIDGRPNATGTSNLLNFYNPNNIAGSHAVVLTNTATKNTFTYCSISSGSIGTIACSAIRLTTGTNNRNDINHCIIDGGNLGIEINGTNGTPNDSTNIFANRIFNQKATAIRLAGGVGRTVIDSNLMYHTIATTTGGYQCYNISQVETTDTVFIYRTRAYDMQTGAGNFIHGIFVSPSVACGTIHAVNNSFVLASATYPNTLSQVIRGVLFTGSLTANLILEHNTFQVGGTHVTANGNPTSAGVVKINTSTASVFTLRNNLLINTRTGTSNQHVGLYLGSPTTGTNTVDYNTYSGGALQQVYLGTTFYSDQTAYRAAATPLDQNSVFSIVDFLNEKDPNIDGTSTNSTVQNLAGNPSAVTKDILGNTRNAITPTRGAIEVSYYSTPLPTTFVKVAAQQSGAVIEVSFSTTNEINMLSYEVEESKDGSNFTKGTNLEAKHGVTNNYTWVDIAVNNGSNYYRIKAIEKNGEVKYSQVVKINIDKQGSGFTVYPNPVKNRTINLQLTNIEKGIYTVKIANNLGQEIASEVLNHNGGSATQIISIGNAQTGRYNMIITNGVTKVTKTVIVE